MASPRTVRNRDAHIYAIYLAAKGNPISAIAQATGLAVQDIQYLRPADRRSFSYAPLPSPPPRPKPAHQHPVIKPHKPPSVVALELACEKHGITVAESKKQHRKRKITWPRQGVMFELFTQCPQLSTPVIGRMLGGRDHTTVLHGVKAHAARIGLSYEDAMAIRQAEADKAGINLSVGSRTKKDRRS